MKYLIQVILIIFASLFVHAEENKILSTAQSGKLDEAKAMLNKLPKGAKRSENLFILANYCFEQGSFSEADKLLNEFFKSTVKDRRFDKDRARATAMREYIKRYGYSGVEDTLKSIKELAKRRDITTEQAIDIANLYSARALNWKKRGIPEYEQVAGFVLQILGKINDNGDAAVAVRVVLLRCRVLSMQGDNRQCINAIEQCLRFYFPDTLKNTYRRYPYQMAVRRLLRELGDQYALLAARENSKKNKIKYYAQAAACYMKSATKLTYRHTEIPLIRDRIAHFRDALMLLGYQLNQPALFHKKDSGKFVLYEDMLKQKRYDAAITAIQKEIKANIKNNKPTPPDLRLLYAQALGCSDRFGDALESCNEALKSKSIPADTPEIILQLAKRAQEKDAKEAALQFYLILCRIAPKHPDIQASLLNCASLALELKQYKIAAQYYAAGAKLTKKPSVKAQSLFNAAQCLYKIHEFANAVEIALEAQVLKENSKQFERQLAFFIGQSSMQAAKTNKKDAAKYFKLAQKQFTAIFNLPDIDKYTKEQSLLLGGIAAFQNGDDKAAIMFFAQYMDLYPKESQSLQVAAYLQSLYLKQDMFQPQCKLLEKLIKHHASDLKTINLIIDSGSHYSSNSIAPKAITIYQYLLKAGDLSNADLLKIISTLRSNLFKQQRKQADTLICGLISKQLPNKPDNEINGELYFILAQTQFAMKKYSHALESLDSILKEKNVYNYFEAKLLHAEALKKLNRQSDARKDYQEILMSGAPKQISAKVSYLLAQSYYETGNDKKAMATAWSTIPISGQPPTDKAQRMWLRKSLELICKCAKSQNNQQDYREAQKLSLAFESK